MSAISQVSIEDWSVTPTVVKALVPIQTSPKAVWKGTDSATPSIGQIQAELTVVEPRKGDPLRRVQLVLSIPHLEAQASTGNTAGYVAAPKLAHIGKVKIEVIVHDRATPAENWSLQQFAYNLFSKQEVIDAIKYGVRPT
jgi:hypothetical protein